MFRVAVPVRVPGVPDEVLQPRATPGPTRTPTTRRPAGSRRCSTLNFARYAGGVPEAVREAGPIAVDTTGVTLDTGVAAG